MRAEAVEQVKQEAREAVAKHSKDLDEEWMFINMLGLAE